MQELKSGKFSSIDEAREVYAIGGGTINRWLQKYDRRDILPRKVRIEMPDEQSQLKKLKKRIRDLEKALADSKVREIINQAHFEVLCEQMGIKDIEGMKKKIAEQLSREEE
jgi:transposase